MSTDFDAIVIGAGPGGEVAASRHVIIATGSEPARPPIDGMDQVPVWTNREATTLREIPPRAVMIGGSAAEIAAVGLTAGQAHDRGIDVAATELDLAETIAPPWTYQTHPAGTLGLLADRRRRVLIGAWAVAPLAGEWIHQAALAIRAEIPVDTLLDGVAQFPTYSEAYLTAAEQLPL